MQHILCGTEEQAQHMSCHMLEGTICEWLQSCGDSRGRFSGCEFSYDLRRLAQPSTLYEKIRDFVSQHPRQFMRAAPVAVIAGSLIFVLFLDYYLE